MKATVILIATVISLNGTQARLEEPLGDLLRVGEVGSVFYELRVGDEVREVEVGPAEVLESSSQRTLLGVSETIQVKSGHRAKFEIPLARLSPSDLARLVELGVEEEADSQAGVAAALPTDGVAPSAAELPAGLGGAVLALLDTWSEAWQRQDVGGYLECYSQDFQPADGSAPDAWRALRTRRLEAPAFIEVELDDIQFDPISADEVRVRFDQRFRSEHYSDFVRKELVLRLEASGWRIVVERALPTG